MHMFSGRGVTVQAGENSGAHGCLLPQIVLPPHLERIREKLAENIHELWALTRIEQGWTYGPVSDYLQHQAGLAAGEWGGMAYDWEGPVAQGRAFTAWGKGVSLGFQWQS